MNYSIEILEKEKHLLNSCLSTWDLNHYPEARKERQKRIDDINDCIAILRCVNDGINPFSESASIHCLNIKRCKDNQ
jgi:hypothetical protein